MEDPETQSLACPTCGYTIAGDSGTCAECGTPFERVHLIAMLASRRVRDRDSNRLALTSAILIGVAVCLAFGGAFAAPRGVPDTIILTIGLLSCASLAIAPFTAVAACIVRPRLRNFFLAFLSVVPVGFMIYAAASFD
jgi:DNA-directed RNA polymerase subunit RPC12/RpoP